MPCRRVFGIHKINNTGVRLRSQPRDGPAKRRGRANGRTDRAGKRERAVGRAKRRKTEKLRLTEQNARVLHASAVKEA